jgi:hypothetical protein
VTAIRTIRSVDPGAERCKAIQRNVPARFSDGQLSHFLAGCVVIQLRP